MAKDNFNPRSYKRSDVPFGYVKMLIHISIHAPTRGATRNDGLYDDEEEISIHAPTRGATQHTSAAITLYFISIHAPTRGATKIMEN